MIALLAKFKSLLIASAASAAIGAAAAWYFFDMKADAARALAAEQEQARLRAAITRTINQAEEMRMIDEEIATDYFNTQIAIAKSEVIVKEIEKYVPVNDPVQCNVPVGVVARVLNPSITGTPADDVPEAAGLSDAEARAASTLTRSAEYEAHAALGRENLGCIAQVNGLIDFVEQRDAWLKAWEQQHDAR